MFALVRSSTEFTWVYTQNLERGMPGVAGGKRGPLVALVLLQTARLFGQGTPAPAFEAASIKPSRAEPNSGSGIPTSKGRISAYNVTLKRCIRGAYDVPESQIFGPKWIDEDRYDIEAKAAGPASDHELMKMLQALLSERFKLTFHRETRALPGYALVVGKTGIKAKRSQPDAESRSSSRTSARRVEIDAEACTMHQLALKLSEAVHLPVADLTAVEGTFDFKLGWTPDDMRAKPLGAVPTDLAGGPSIFEALQEQLGLKLEARKVPTEVLVIDHAEKASEN
jgi:uncharacterized protein (TIGR03435 family)